MTEHIAAEAGSVAVGSDLQDQLPQGVVGVLRGRVAQIRDLCDRRQLSGGAVTILRCGAGQIGRGYLTMSRRIVGVSDVACWGRDLRHLVIGVVGVLYVIHSSRELWLDDLEQPSQRIVHVLRDNSVAIGHGSYPS